MGPIAPELTDTDLRVMLQQLMEDTQAVVQQFSRVLDARDERIRELETKRQTLLFYLRHRLQWIARTTGVEPIDRRVLFDRGNELRQLIATLDLAVTDVPTDAEEAARLEQPQEPGRG